MSRSNTNYYNVCDDPIDETGHCEWHQEYSWLGRQRKCIPPGKFFSRRPWVRKKRFPDWGWKRHCPGPPRSFKRLWQRKLRTMQRDELRKTGDVLLDADKMLIGWYGYWS
jgi:hypothetical protein